MQYRSVLKCHATHTKTPRQLLQSDGMATFKPECDVSRLHLHCLVLLTRGIVSSLVVGFY